MDLLGKLQSNTGVAQHPVRCTDVNEHTSEIAKAIHSCSKQFFGMHRVTGALLEHLAVCRELPGLHILTPPARGPR